MIVKEGNKFIVKNEKGTKNLSKLTSKKKAVRRLKQVEWFKSHPK